MRGNRGARGLQYLFRGAVLAATVVATAAAIVAMTAVAADHGSGEGVSGLKDAVPKEDPIDAIDGILARCERAFGSRYGGAYLTHGRKGETLTVMVVRPTQDDRRRLSSLAAPQSARMRAARYGEKEAMEIKDRLSVILQEERVRPSGVGFDEERQRFDIFARSVDRDTRARLKREVPGRELRFVIAREFDVQPVPG